MSSPAAQSDWRRLDSRMVLIHPVREVIRFLPALVGLLFAGGQVGQHWYGALGAVVPIALGVARWFTTRYRFTAQQVQLRRGLVNKTELSAPLDRVRSVDVTATLLHRALGLAVVKIGTGAANSNDGSVILDGLSAKQAAALRRDLLHRVDAERVAAQGDSPTTDVNGQAREAAKAARPAYVEAPDEVLYTMRPAWFALAPLAPAGFITALALLGVGAQVISQAGIDLTENGAVRDGVDLARGFGVMVVVAVAVVAGLAFIVIVALIGSVLTWFGFRLSRDPGGRTFHVSRGLLTTRNTSMEARRLRGVELHEPIPMRWARAASLSAITTGVAGKKSQDSSSLTPPSPRVVVARTADAILGARGVLDIPIAGHGPVAARRRYTRALLGWIALTALASVPLVALDLLPYAGVAAVGLLVLALLLGRSRAAALGHALTDRFLIGRSGAVDRETFVVERTAAVAVTYRQTFFQRRAGVATVLLATAAGDQEYAVLDVPAEAGAVLFTELLDTVRTH
ncbi:PH domain-containing protein [Calidifontibacter sp. DB0510]|uniref:PH domain-containing protein n=1 Tax=Metallococcus carri TaxID=1656884 RepID=A0A967AYY2_9MICO|nr:PH domain-containing protein [Metallococcus carri]NHN55649.1 PH domain-containing protein [Metallococcus carri]NOP38167.1 PH domain-containing protein [Calidifontibacter sp. DB2511S]